MSFSLSIGYCSDIFLIVRAFLCLTLLYKNIGGCLSYNFRTFGNVTL
nr:MAG TPA: hypothetical protein [Caudoviricetes sp.]